MLAHHLQRQRCRIRPTINDRCTSQQTRAVDPMLFQFRADVGDGGPTFKQLCIIVGHVSYTVLAARYCPANTKHLYNICTTLAKSLRRRPNIVQMVYKCLCFLGAVLARQVKALRVKVYC